MTANPHDAALEKQRSAIEAHVKSRLIHRTHGLVTVAKPVGWGVSAVEGGTVGDIDVGEGDLRVRKVSPMWQISVTSPISAGLNAARAQAAGAADLEVGLVFHGKDGAEYVAATGAQETVENLGKTAGLFSAATLPSRVRAIDASLYKRVEQAFYHMKDDAEVAGPYAVLIPQDALSTVSHEERRRIEDPAEGLNTKIIQTNAVDPSGGSGYAGFLSTADGNNLLTPGTNWRVYRRNSDWVIEETFAFRVIKPAAAIHLFTQWPLVQGS